MTVPRRWNGRPRPAHAKAIPAVVRADVCLVAGGGFVRRFGSWDEARDWLQSPGLVRQLPGISSIKLVHVAAQRDAAPTAGDRTA